MPYVPSSWDFVYQNFSSSVNLYWTAQLSRSFRYRKNKSGIFIIKSSTFGHKNIGHIIGQKSKMMCPILFLWMICNLWLHELTLARHDLKARAFMNWIALYAPQCNSWTKFNSWFQRNQFMPARAIHCNSQSELLASLFDSNCNCNCNGSANHGVVTHTDKSHHFFAVDALGEL